MTNPADLGIADAGRALRAGELTSVALTQACLDRIAERNPKIGAFVHLAPEQALASARQADALLAKGEDLGPLHGIPFAVKDVFDVEGWPVRFGCAHDRDRVARKNADMVDLCLKAGAIALGIVATYELATVGPDRTSLYPQPRNPWNADHVTGGSSSGSAAAVASGMVRFALGSDTGGSARSPAAYCGIVGFKPSAGRFGKGGLMPLAPSMDHVGLLAATAADAATLFAALAGPSGNAVTAAPRRIVFGRNWCHGDAPAILTLMDDAASALSLLGHQIVLEDLPDYQQIEDDGATILLAEQITAQWTRLKDDAAQVGKMAYASLQLGLGISEADLHAARHRAEEFTAAIDTILTRHAAVILPTTMTTAPRFSEFDSGKPVWTAMRTLPFNLTGHPALSVPIGMHNGLPLAMQIIGAKGADAQVLAIGAAFEAATDHGVLPPYLS